MPLLKRGLGEWVTRAAGFHHPNTRNFFHSPSARTREACVGTRFRPGLMSVALPGLALSARRTAR